ncbi:MULTISPECIES: hypothetical protein [Gordonia]|uniref:hypothetical protein n=1 Tax=Gordonia TaxID=2053 RepID=UPI0025BFB850|nr:hypothetical protein [Gordonia sp. UBA5067]
MTADADGLIAAGLRDAGYRLIVAACNHSPHRGAVAAALRERGVTLTAALPPRAAEVRATGVEVAGLRTELTAAVMAVSPWVVMGRPDSLPAAVLAILANHDVLALAGDSRAAFGGTVREDSEAVVRSRAIGTKGLIVSLTNRRRDAAAIGVPIALLGLTGTIRGVDAWTGQEVVSRAGWLGGTVGAGDTILLEIV